jgi:hypothetical protein
VSQSFSSPAAGLFGSQKRHVTFTRIWAVASIPTAPTNHLPDGWTLNKNTRGQKGADKANDPVLCFFLAARVTAGFELSGV